MATSRPFIVFGAPALEEDEIREVEATLRSGWIGTGPRVARFERDFARYKGVGDKQVAAVASCTAALHVSMIAAGLEPGDEVITTPLTFCASVNAIIHAGLRPVLADIDPHTQNIDPAAIAAAIGPRTRAILPVHMAGRPCDMDAIMALAERHRLVVIEDCAHAIESTIGGRQVGTFGDFGCFSFYATKNVATGEGGMVLGRDAEATGRVKVLALHGMSRDAWKRFSDEGYKHYQVVDIGFKYNMMDLQAALGIHQLARVQRNWLRRHELWQRYLEAFADLPVTLPAPFAPGTRHALHLFTLGVDTARAGLSRDEFLQRMTRCGIGVGVHYLSVPEHPAYQQRFGWSPDAFPAARDVGRSTVSLPLSPKLSDDDVAYIIDQVRATLRARRAVPA
jgi:dTDP-4-amino-4,6-dideoxygalactose transaminase